MRLQEIHAAVVHYPIALFPTALGADALGKISDSTSLAQAGKWGIALSAGAAALSVATGAIAQETTKLEGTPHDLLVSHRNLNLGFLGLASAMAVHRAGKSSPGLGYLAVGTAGLGAMVYSAYLGGHMVYEYGAAVKAAGTVDEERAPELRADNARQVMYIAARNLVDGVRNTVNSLTTEPVLPNWSQKDTFEKPAPTEEETPS